MEKDLEYLIKSKKLDPVKAFRRNRGTYKDNTREYLMHWQNEVWARKPIAGFHPGIYRDLAMGKGNKTDPFVHYLRAGSPIGKWKTEIISSAKREIVDTRQAKVALHIHAYYAELIIDIASSLQINKTKPDIFITTPKYKEVMGSVNTLEETGCKVVDIIQTPNKGRDIGPLVTHLGSHLESNYDIYGHIHTKKSVGIDRIAARKWRYFLYQNLLGSQDINMMDIIVKTLMEEKTLGLVFPDDPYCIGWSSNRGIAENLAKKLEINVLPRSFEFPVGTMFWAKSKALSRLYNLNLKWDDMPKEPLNYDGTILHAIERLIPIIAECEGYKYKMTNVNAITR